MTDSSDLTAVLVGPLGQRAPLMATLERSGCWLEPGQGSRGHHQGFVDLLEDPTLGSIMLRCSDVNRVADTARQSGWSLRLHYDTPTCGVCRGRGTANVGDSGLGTCLHCAGTGRTNQPAPTSEQLLRAELDAMRAEIEALKGSR